MQLVTAGVVIGFSMNLASLDNKRGTLLMQKEISTDVITQQKQDTIPIIITMATASIIMMIMISFTSTRVEDVGTNKERHKVWGL